MEVRWSGKKNTNRRVEVVTRFEHLPNGVYGGPCATKAEAAAEAIMRLIDYQHELACELKATERAIKKLEEVVKQVSPLDRHLNKEFGNIVNTPPIHNP